MAGKEPKVLGTEITLGAEEKKQKHYFKPSAGFKYTIPLWPAPGREAEEAAEAAKEGPAEYVEIDCSLAAEVTSVGVELDLAERDKTTEECIREFGKEFADKNQNIMRLFSEAKTPYRKLLCDGEVGRVEFKFLEEAGFEYQPTTGGDREYKIGLIGIEFVDLQAELKFEFKLGVNEAAEAEKAAHGADVSPRKWKIGVLSGELAFKPVVLPDFVLGKGILIKAPSLEIKAGVEVSPRWRAIGERLLKDWIPRALEAVASDAGLAVIEGALAVAAIYVAARGSYELYESVRALRDLERLTSKVPAVKEEICQGFIEGVQKSVRDRPVPEKTPRGAGQQIGARAKQDVGTRLRKEHAGDPAYAQGEFDRTFDDRIVERTSDPKVQQELLAKARASGVIESIARCIVFAAWADQHDGQPTAIKRAAWANLFPDWRNDEQEASLTERRTLLQALGAKALVDYYGGKVPPAAQVAEVTL